MGCYVQVVEKVVGAIPASGRGSLAANEAAVALACRVGTLLVMRLSLAI